MPVWSSLELVCRLAVVVAGQTTTVFDFCRVVDVVSYHFMIEDRVDRCSSYIWHATKYCY